MTVIALTITGSEASGDAGTQTGLKTSHILGVYGCTVSTCIVSMDPEDGWNHRFIPMDPGVIADRTETCAAVHSHIDAVKISMLGTAPTIDVAKQALETHDFLIVVFNPVLICRGREFGGALEVDNALHTKILPCATITTPNLFEAATLTGMEKITIAEQLKDVARHIHDQSVPNVLARASPSLGTDTTLDIFYDGTTLEVLEVGAVGTECVHGVDYTLVVAVTVELIKGASPLEAAVTAREVVPPSIRHGLHGNVPFLCVYRDGYRQS